MVVLSGGTIGSFAASVACVTVENPETGEEQKKCMYVIQRLPASTWAFISAIHTNYNGPDGNVGIDYESAYKDIENSLVWHEVDTCEDGWILVSEEEGEFLKGFDCKTDFEILDETFEKAKDVLESWFWESGGCHLSVDVAGAALGLGAARLVVKQSIKKIYKMALEQATTRELAEAAEKALRKQHAADVVGVFVGIVLGEVINEMVCDQLEKALRNNN